MAKKRKVNKRISKRKGNLFEKLFLLDLKRDFIILGLWIFSVFAHNAFSAFFSYEEAFFSTLVVIVIPIYVFIGIIYTFIFHKNKNKIRR